ncbi:MAG TPA: PQQ-binding-like beta-propeller repeat protein [Bryobacteraceae bacterium]|nr:PQQ-binding-like beta-propeller repeat protein [Bryobacteraceae bacterium]
MFLISIVTILMLPAAAAEDWTRFRGANGSGVSASKGFPAELGKNKNVLWRSPVRPGKSSPVLTSRHVFLTGFEDGKLYTQCFDRKTGKLLWERSVDKSRSEVAHQLNHEAAITPVTDGENVYVLFKDYGFVSYDAAGNLRWKSPLAQFSNTMGAAASPILAGDYVVLLADQTEGAFIAAYDKRNGELRWRTAREESEAWGTPLVYHPSAGEAQILTTGRGQFGSHRLKDGKRLATLHGLPIAIVGSPILANGNLYVQGYGNDAPAPFSQRLEKLDKNHDGKLSPDEYGNDAFLTGIAKYKGNRDMILTEDEWKEKQLEVLGPNCLIGFRLEASGPPRELWRYEKSFTGVIPTPLLYEDVLYFVKNGGIFTALEPHTGKALKAGRLPGAVGGYSSSPVAADGKIYLASEDGNVSVLRAGKDWEVVSVNDFGEGCYATPALSEGNVYLRTDRALYRFGSTGR